MMECQAWFTCSPSENPSCRHTTMASLLSQPASQTGIQLPLAHISTYPVTRFLLCVPFTLIPPSDSVMSMNSWHWALVSAVRLGETPECQCMHLLASCEDLLWSVAMTASHTNTSALQYTTLTALHQESN